MRRVELKVWLSLASAKVKPRNNKDIIIAQRCEGSQPTLRKLGPNNLSVHWDHRSSTETFCNIRRGELRHDPTEEMGSINKQYVLPSSLQKIQKATRIVNATEPCLCASRVPLVAYCLSFPVITQLFSMLKINVGTVALFAVYMPNIHHKPTKWLIQQPVDACWSSSFEVRIEVRRSLESQWQPGETRENPLESKILRYTDIDSTFCPTTSSCSYVFVSLTKPPNIPQQTNQKKRKREKKTRNATPKKWWKRCSPHNWRLAQSHERWTFLQAFYRTGPGSQAEFRIGCLWGNEATKGLMFPRLPKNIGLPKKKIHQLLAIPFKKNTPKKIQ